MAPLHPEQAELLVASLLPVASVAHWVDHGDAGWVCQETGEVLTPTG